jgi:thiamine transport system ATP-binding protein
MKGLDIHDVSLSYDTVQVLDHVSLSVDDGHIVAVLGPSGSGKSSLLRVIAGLIPTASGSVSVKGVDVTSLPTHKRGVGMVFQNNQLFPHLNVEGNVGYGLRIAGVKRSVIAERVADLLSLVGLDSHVKRDVATLSGGEAARVALARSLATEPAVLLLDEPLSGLDHDLRYPLADELRRVIKTAGITAVIVTHDPVEAERIADRTVRMSELSSTTR